MKTCYMCDAPATSKEHVPPKCIFPEGRIYRKNLIQVPSCNEHNSRKSKADEYLKFILTAGGGMNELASSVFQGSVMRSFDYRPHLINRFTPSLEVIQVGDFETGGFDLDWPRFQCSIASLVRGLHFHETGKKLTCEITGAAWAQMLTVNYSQAPFIETIAKAESERPANHKGANPRAFQYSFGASKNGRISFCRLRFYEGHPIYATWKSTVCPNQV
jgi:hypothetical protein